MVTFYVQRLHEEHEEAIRNRESLEAVKDAEADDDADEDFDSDSEWLETPSSTNPAVAEITQALAKTTQNPSDHFVESTLME